jgi:hypothetical protein
MISTERQNPLKRLRSLLQAGDDPGLLGFARSQRRTLSYLTALTYDPDPDLAWAAIRAMGLVAAELADRDPEFVRGHLRRLVWLLNDESGGIGWRAPEALGAILAGRPDCFADFIPILVSLLDMEAEDAIRFRAGTLWAIGRLAQAAPGPASQALPWVLPALRDPDPQVRGLALWCLGQFPELPELPLEQIRIQAEDPQEVAIFTGDGWRFASLAELAQDVLTRVSS